MSDFGERIELSISTPQAPEALVPLATFSTALEGLHALLAQVTIDWSGRPEITWYVRELQTGSASVVIKGVATKAGDADAVQAVIRTVIDALAALERGDNVRDLLSFAAIEPLAELASAAKQGGGQIVVRGCGRSIILTSVGADSAQALVDRRYRSFGTVEGYIETVSVRGDVRSFGVAHALDGFIINCWSDDKQFAHAKAALGARVWVTGEILRRGNGRAESVQVSDIRVLRNSEGLATVEEIRGILSDRPEVVALGVDYKRHG